MIRRTSTRRGVCFGFAVTCLVLTASAAFTQEAPRPVRTLGGATRFVAPVNDIAALARSMGRPTIQVDLATVLERAGMPALTEQVQHNLAVGQVTAATLPQGTVMQWMALRSGGPNVARNLRWDGDAPLAGFSFTVDDLNQTYHFFVPSICGNVSFIRSEPSLEAARQARFAQEDAARAAATQAAAATEQARLAAERAAAAERARLVAAEAAAAAQARLEAEWEAGEQARLAAEQALADYLAAEQRDLRVRPFLAGFVGIQERQYDDTDPAGLGRLPIRSAGPGLPLLDVPAFFDSLLGVKGGVALKMTDHWTFTPALGVAANLHETERTTLFGDAELDFVFGSGTYLGTGLTFWDFTHTESFTPGWLGTVGVPLWRSDERMNQLLFGVEYRQFFDRFTDSDVNYQAWGGLKYLFK
jgi:hypothetical protein